MKKLLYAAFLLPLLFISDQLFAQQLPLFTQYREYYGYVNPASISIDFLASDRRAFNAFGASHRRQWIGSTFPTVTSTVGRGEFFFSGNGSVSFLAGGYFMSDKAGAISFNGAYGRAALFIGDIEYGSFFSIGFTAGAVQHRVKTNRLAAFDLTDPLLFVDANTIFPDLGAGIFGVLKANRDINLYGGISIPQLFGLQLDLPTEEGVFTYERLFHLYNYAGVYINTSQGYDDYSFLEISVWGKYLPGLPYHADLNFRYQISTPFWIGVGASTTQNVHLETGVNLNFSNRDGYMKIGYGFDFPFNTDYASYVGSSHEINLTFIFEK